MGGGCSLRVCGAECRGHADVQLGHRSTLELEARGTLTIRGDCVACVSCRNTEELEDCAGLRGLGKLFIVGFSLSPPHVEGLVVDGLLPGKPPRGRLVARKSCHRPALLLGAPVAAADASTGLRLVLSSPTGRCVALLFALTGCGEVDPVYEAAGCVVEDPRDPEDGQA